MVLSGRSPAGQRCPLYPALQKVEQEGWITAEWRPSKNNRRAKFYSLTRLGRRLEIRKSPAIPSTSRWCLIARLADAPPPMLWLISTPARSARLRNSSPLAVAVFGHRVVLDARYSGTLKKTEQGDQLMRDIVESVLVPV